MTEQIHIMSEISIHVPAWGTTADTPPILKANGISIHVPAWGTTTIRKENGMLTRFQSTFPRGERPVCLTDCRPLAYFNPRSRVGNDAIVFLTLQKQLNFNPRSRVGNDRAGISVLMRLQEVSIHVPAWGTTGGTVAVSSVGCIFQSTFPRGERRQRTVTHPIYRPISIHVPAWGTTGRYATDSQGKRNFNPRSRVGNDLLAIKIK